MVEHNPEMIGDVYEDLSEQNFDLFEHIEYKHGKLKIQ